MVAAAALLAEGSKQRGDVFSQDAGAVLYEEADQLTHLRDGERNTHCDFSHIFTPAAAAAADNSF